MGWKLDVGWFDAERQHYSEQPLIKMDIGCEDGWNTSMFKAVMSACGREEAISESAWRAVLQASASGES
jgi:hypothetical protein